MRVGEETTDILQWMLVLGYYLGVVFRLDHILEDSKSHEYSSKYFIYAYISNLYMLFYILLINYL